MQGLPIHTEYSGYAVENDIQVVKIVQKVVKIA